MDVARTLAPTLGSLNTIYFYVRRPAEFDHLIQGYLDTHVMRRRSRRKGWGPNTDAELFAEALKTLEVLSKISRRRSERVNLVIVDPDDYLLEEGRTAFAKVLSEVE